MELQYSRSEKETVQIGEKIGRKLHPPRVILLYGELGSGKTVLVRGLAEGLGVKDTTQVRSPSFTLVNEYQGREGTIYHIDFYRLEGPRDFFSIGLEEILATRSIVIIEWAEKLLLEPDNPVKIRIFVDTHPESRRLEIENGEDTQDKNPDHT